MCGIAGFYDPTGLEAASARAYARAMSGAIVHRGPDGSGEWVDAENGIALGHRRLAVIDLTEAGAQPMTSGSGRWVVSYNGEIYNFQALRSELSKSDPTPDWRGHSDTEVVLAAIDRWGFEATLARLNGMFALAVWDRQERALWLARDRFGEKPIYYGWSGGMFLFASELKAMTGHPAFQPRIDRDALGMFVKYGFVPHPWSIYEGIGKLPPGGWVRLSSQHRRGDKPDAGRYWDIDQVISDARAAPFEGDMDAAADRLDQILGDAVEARMVSDVPLGSLLSGGLDSSLIVALMQARSARPVSTFTIGNTEPGYDEAEHAGRIARHLGTDHNEFYVDPGDALDLVPHLGEMYDEPFADSSQIPTHIVARLVRQSGTVALSGDCGDELFGGYNRYIHGVRIADTVMRLPDALRRSAAAVMKLATPSAINRVAGTLGTILPEELKGGMAGEKIHKLAGAVAVPGRSDFWEFLLSNWSDPHTVLSGDFNAVNLTDYCRAPAGLQGLAEQMMYHDTRYYMSDDVLAKVDRASMASSLEVRVPFLDPAVFAFAWSIPVAMKIGNGRGKLVLRRLLSRYLPDHLVERPKQGFAVPVGRWLRQDLREWAEPLIDATRLEREGYFDAAAVQRCWSEHLSGRRNHDARLWTILMFQAWLDQSGPGCRHNSA